LSSVRFSVELSENSTLMQQKAKRVQHRNKKWWQN